MKLGLFKIATLLAFLKGAQSQDCSADQYCVNACNICSNTCNGVDSGTTTSAAPTCDTTVFLPTFAASGKTIDFRIDDADGNLKWRAKAKDDGSGVWDCTRLWDQDGDVHKNNAPNPIYDNTNCAETVYNVEIAPGACTGCTFRLDDIIGSNIAYYEATWDGTTFTPCNPDGCVRAKAGTDKHSCG